MFDIVIISKNRFSLCYKQVKRIYESGIKYNKIIVVESSEKFPSGYIKELYKMNVLLLKTPNATLGKARQTGLKSCTTDYIFMIDDDIIFEDSFIKDCYNAIRKYELIDNVFALSPIIIFGDDEDIKRIFRAKNDKEGVSGGCCILNRNKLLKIKGYNVDVHIGEDAELFYRGKLSGYKWIRKHDISVNHPLTKKDLIFRVWKNRYGHYVSIAYGFKTIPLLLIDRVRDIIVNVFQVFRVKNLRTTLYIISMNFIAIIALIRVMIGGMKYALYKKKIRKSI